MTSAALTCPYCNATIANDARTAPTRMSCPRCHELVVNRRSSVAAAPTAAAEPTEVPPSAPTPQPARTVGTLIGIMVGMACVALAFALYTQKVRRDRDRPRTEAELVPSAPAFVAPAALPTLGYLPPSTNVVLAVHVAEVLASPGGRDLLALQRLGNLPISTEHLAAHVGLRIEDLDHLVLGLRVDDRLPRPVLLVQTTQPYNETALRTKLKANRKVERGGRTLHRFTLEKPPLEMLVWFASPRLLVASFQPEDFDEIPQQPVTALANLAEPLRKVLTERLQAPAPLWTIGHAADWSKTSAALALELLAPPIRQRVLSLRTFGLWIRPGTTIQGNALLACATDDDAEAFRVWLGKGSEAGKAEGRVEASQELWREIRANLVATRQANQVELATQCRAEAVRALLPDAQP